MSKALRIILNALLFNVGWLACVLSSRWEAPLAALPIVLVIVGLQILLTSPRERLAEFQAILAVALLGTIVDCVMLLAGVLKFQGSSELTLTFVLWIGSFWLNFAPLLNIALAWCRRYWIIAIILAAISAPGTYYFGERLGALALHESKSLALGAIAIEWAILFPAALWVAGRIRTMRAPRSPAASDTAP